MITCDHRELADNKYHIDSRRYIILKVGFMTRSYASSLTISGDAFIDLQTRTQLSDGKWTPEALIDHSVTEVFSVAAITDHARVDTLADVQRIARERSAARSG
jgi:hypothetical protein